MIDHQKSKKALKHLERQFENYRRLDQRPYLTELDREAIRESVIQRFETCYDSLWKHLKRYLVETLGLPEVPNSPKPVLRLANENQLLGDISRWLRYADARIATAHDYSGSKLEAALPLPGFIDDAIHLYETLSGETWE